MVKIPKRTKAIILDLDQTLIKFNVDWDNLRQTTAKIFKKYGFEMDYKSLRPLFEQTAKQLRALDNSGNSRQTTSQILNELLVAQEEFETKSINTTLLYPDTKPFLEYVSNQNLQMGLLTSNLSTVTKEIFSRFQISFKGPIVGRKEVKYPKPDLEGITKLLRKLHLNGNKCVLIGDADSDMEVANKIGAIAVFLKRNPNQYLTYSKANLVINSLSEISLD